MISMKWIRFSGWPFVLFFLLALSPQVLIGQQITLSESFVAGQRAVKNTSQTCIAPSFTSCPAAPEYNLIALRVAFQPDTSRFTTGNGTFNGALFDSLEAKVDPLPHDAGYFNAHLQFLSNYVTKVSDGKTRVETHLVPEVIQLSQEMSAYSPIGLEADSDAELQKLALLVQEAWELANNQSSFDASGFDPATTAFMIFHAGVGRDIELIGTTLDKTPQDLPTIYFNQDALNRLVQQSITFKGLPVQHTMLMPRTETRQGFDFIQDQPFLVEFSINGLMAASFFNYLGVPDLFNTESGESAIGPFGLMDPLGLFAYNGLFPPEPSGWTKKYLGWTDPARVEGDDEQAITLLAASSISDQELVQIPISESEYFLVENRYRDLTNDGLVLTIYRDGALFEQRIENGAEEFNSINIDAFDGGVVVDVDDYDWALPGGVDENGNQLLGGTLVWHIDERVLTEKLPTNSVNSDPDLRAIDLEEADSAQDLGFPSGSIFGPQAHLGTPFDFFFEDNPVLVITSTGEEISLYQNRFSSGTQPNSNSNAGGNSFIELKDFTRPGLSTTFTYARDEPESVRIVDSFPDIGNGDVPPASYVSAASNTKDGVFFLGSTNELVGAYSGSDQTLRVSGNFLSNPIVFPGDQVVILDANDEGEVHLGVIRDSLYVQLPLGVTIGASERFDPKNVLLYEPTQGFIYALFNTSSFNGLLEIRLNSNNAVANVLNFPVNSLFSIAATPAGRVAILTEQNVLWLRENTQGWDVDISGSQIPGQLAIGDDNTGTVGAFTIPQTNELFFLRANGTVERIDVSQYVPEGQLSRSVVLADVDIDGILDALVSVGEYVIAVSPGGGLMESFPLHVPAEITTIPLVAESADGTSWVVFAGAANGQLYSFDLANRGQTLEGFPLAVGTSISASPFIEDTRIYGVSSTGSLSVWATTKIGDSWWGIPGVNRFNSHYVNAVVDLPRDPDDGFLRQGEVYNWPNPIRDGRTFIRLASTIDIDVQITIIDGAGTLVDRIDVGLIRARSPVDIQWTTDVGSGLYFARVKASDANGNSETSLIKMAVIR